LHYKTFTLPTPVTAEFIRFWADTPQGETNSEVQIGDIRFFSDTVTGLTPRPPPPPDAPVTEQFTIAAGNPANVVSHGVVGTELENTCTVPPASQDSDGHASVVQGEGGDGQHDFAVTAGATAVDVDVYMYDENCRQLGSDPTVAADEQAPSRPGPHSFSLRCTPEPRPNSLSPSPTPSSTAGDTLPGSRAWRDRGRPSPPVTSLKASRRGVSRMP
jgi:hypothetical protein